LHNAFLVLDKLAGGRRTESGGNARDDLAATMQWLGIATDEDFAEARADSEDLRETIRAAAAGIDLNALKEKVQARLAARKAKDFKESDRIRDELVAQGIVLKDNPDGTTTWDVKR
jgi:cysteinyl-tRNA synthetase